jgi:hypothetical protein
MSHSQRKKFLSSHLCMSVVDLFLIARCRSGAQHPQVCGAQLHVARFRPHQRADDDQIPESPISTTGV